MESRIVDLEMAARYEEQLLGRILSVYDLAIIVFDKAIEHVQMRPTKY